MLYIGETGRPLRTRFGEPRHAVVGKDAVVTSLLPYILILAISMFQTWKFEASVPFLGVTIAAKYMKCASFQTWHCPSL
jgi:hypothetical protein